MKKIKSIILVSILFIGCSKKTLNYVLEDHYSGPGILIVCKSMPEKFSANKILINNGMGKISIADKKKNFIFSSQQKKKEIDIVPIGQENLLKDKSQHIFQLLNGIKPGKCEERFEYISFFFGTKTEFDIWKGNNVTAFEYFENMGVNFCDSCKR